MRQVQLGDVVGDYRVLEVAGSGGMGEVYKIEHVITKRIEAMKLLPPASSSDPEQVQRFEREIQVQARLHHPNIVALYNAVRENNLIGLVMEFLVGGRVSANQTGVRCPAGCNRGRLRVPGSARASLRARGRSHSSRCGAGEHDYHAGARREVDGFWFGARRYRPSPLGHRSASGLAVVHVAGTGQALIGPDGCAHRHLCDRRRFP